MKMELNFTFVIMILMICGTVLCNLIPNINTTKTFILNTDLKASWHRANHYCMSNGMRLATILSKDENDQIVKQIKESGFVDSFWIGGVNYGNEPHFYWMGNKKPMVFTDWQVGQPDNRGGYENCIEIWTHENHKWNDERCWELNNFICEETDVRFNIDVRSDADLL